MEARPPLETISDRLESVARPAKEPVNDRRVDEPRNRRALMRNTSPTGEKQRITKIFPHAGYEEFAHFCGSIRDPGLLCDISGRCYDAVKLLLRKEAVGMNPLLSRSFT